ncbi:DUF192 domain-containing protein [Modicisalibacter tunisiensis]|uniref:DUF192 domain-containing protein n=1 Tax=Modicisalibacter tunisiensis TaxID=390637 RepID=A0ABS7X045_9GAMM|nr:DUF192 domain-containing protein [Modicisalibacter tunisiensis]KXS36798.1 MAG: hypothetical protein AWU55_2879 [Halomonadaceae bacterium T82-2]MBZ9567818.1 DUF192 domain-containing protein [Modicisalibacter tunisiensis]
MPRRGVVFALWCGLAVLGVLTGWAGVQAGDLEQRTLVIVSGDRRQAIQAEIARRPADRARGLMERERLPAGAGMLFLFPREQSATGAFWMFNTRIPLSIAFIDTQGVIRAIRRMVPCASERPADCPRYPAGVPFRMALEVNAGFFARHGITVGDRLLPTSLP